MVQHDVRALSGLLNAVIAAVVAVGVGAAGCAAPKPEPEEPEPAPSNHQMVNPLVDDEDDPDGLQVEGTLGTISQGAIQIGIGPRLDRVNRCFQEEARTRPYLGGEVGFKFRISRDGSIKTLSLAQSSLGSFRAERCMVSALADARFERPHGGEAEFTYTMAFTARLPSQPWDPAMVKDEMTGAVEELLTVKERRGPDTLLQAPAGLVLTFYVGPNGRALSVGMVADEAIDEEFPERLAENLKKVKFVEPDGRYAKVTYQW